MMWAVADAHAVKPLLDKLGVRPDSRVSVLGVRDGWFLADLRDRGAEAVRGRIRKRTDMFFLAVEETVDLDRLGGLEPFMERDGAVWVVYPKGRKDLKVVDVIRAGVATGLVDNKVVRFSDTHTALRFVIPRARR